MLTIVPCPECGVPAEVTDPFWLPSTDGPVAHATVRCAAGHQFVMATERLDPAAQERPHPAARRAWDGSAFYP